MAHRKWLVKLNSDFFPEILTETLKIINWHCCEQFHVETIFFAPDYCIVTQSKVWARDSERLYQRRVPAWNCSQQVLWFILSIRFMISRKILGCWARRQTTLWTMSRKLTLKQSRWSNITTGRRKNMYFWLILVNCPFKEWNVRKIQLEVQWKKRRPTAQRWNTEVQQMLKMILYICTKVSALRNISGKSWITIHPAHTRQSGTHTQRKYSLKCDVEWGNVSQVSTWLWNAAEATSLPD